MSGKNHYKNCSCIFCIPGTKKEDLEKDVLEEDGKHKCRYCGRPVIVNYYKRGGGYSVMNDTTPPTRHVCWERDDKTLDLFASD